MKKEEAVEQFDKIEDMEQAIVPERREMYVKDKEFFVLIEHKYSVDHAKKVLDVLQEKIDKVNEAIAINEEAFSNAEATIVESHEKMVSEAVDALANSGNDEWIVNKKDELFKAFMENQKTIVDKQDEILKQGQDRLEEEKQGYLQAAHKVAYDTSNLLKEWSAGLENAKEC